MKNSENFNNDVLMTMLWLIVTAEGGSRMKTWIVRR